MQSVPDTVLVRSPLVGRVLVAHSGAPVDRAQVSLLGTGITVITDAAGRFSIEIPPGRHHVLQARRIGIMQRTMPIRVDPSMPPDTLVILMEDWYHLEKQRLARLLDPTPVTPCRPRDSTSLEQEEALRLFLSSSPDPYPSAAPEMGLRAFLDQEPRHVIDRELCARVARAVNDYIQTPGRRTQVHLFRLGRPGYAAYDPSIRDGEWDAMYWFDARLRLLVATQW